VRALGTLQEPQHPHRRSQLCSHGTLPRPLVANSPVSAATVIQPAVYEMYRPRLCMESTATARLHTYKIQIWTASSTRAGWSPLFHMNTEQGATHWGKNAHAAKAAMTSSSDGEDDDCPTVDHPCIQPNQVIPGLYLANAYTEGVLGVLEKYGITHVLQVIHSLWCQAPCSMSHAPLLQGA
jgi:hypothetical protein